MFNFFFKENTLKENIEKQLIKLDKVLLIQNTNINMNKNKNNNINNTNNTNTKNTETIDTKYIQILSKISKYIKLAIKANKLSPNSTNNSTNTNTNISQQFDSLFSSTKSNTNTTNILEILITKFYQLENHKELYSQGFLSNLLEIFLDINLIDNGINKINNTNILYNNLHLLELILTKLLPLTFEKQNNTSIVNFVYEITDKILYSNKNNTNFTDNDINHNHNPNTYNLVLPTNLTNDILDLKTLIFSIVINLMKTEHLTKNIQFKFNLRKTMILLFKYKSIYSTLFFENSFVSEVLIERLTVYFELMPNKFDIWENGSSKETGNICNSTKTVNIGKDNKENKYNKDNTNETNPNYNLDSNIITLDIAYNLSRTFPLLLEDYLEFRDFILFFDKLFSIQENRTLSNQILVLFFNWFLLSYLQPRLLSHDIKELRSTIQYVVFLFKFLQNKRLILILYNFIFGFNDSNTNFKYKKSGYEGLKYIKEINEIKDLENTNNFSNEENYDSNNGNNDISTNIEYILNDYSDSLDYKKHDHIGIIHNIFSNINNNTSYINIVILTLFEISIEKCPYLQVFRVFQPFCEAIIEKYHLNSEKLSVKPKVDLTRFINFLYLLENSNNSGSGTNTNNPNTTNNKNTNLILTDYLEYNIHHINDNFIKQDIDFYAYYSDIQSDKNNLRDCINNNGNNTNNITNNTHNTYNNTTTTNYFDNINQNSKLRISNSPDKESFFNSVQNNRSSILRNSTYDKGQVLNHYLLSQKSYKHAALHTNIHNSYRTYKNKIFNDEADAVEEELSNVYIKIMKHLIEKTTNFMNNKPIENLFLCNLLSSIMKIFTLDFDPIVCLFFTLILDADSDSPCSILNILNYVSGI